MRHSISSLVVAAALALLACGCGRQSISPDLEAHLSASSAETARPKPRIAGPRHLEGEIGPGALYRIDVPEVHNGGLVLFVHGYTPPQSEVALPDITSLRNSLLAQGFAVAVSSFSETGYAVAEGARQSHQLLGLFADRCGEPDYTLLIGVSMGGLIGLELTEKFPGQIDGALLVSGVVGGSKAEVNYIGDVRVLWDYFFPGTIPGSLFDVPEGVPFNPNWALAAIQQDPDRFRLFLAFASQRGLPIGGGNEPVLATLNALGFQWMGAMDLFDRTHGHVLYDNQGVSYTAPSGVPQAVVDAVNTGVARYQATADAEAFLKRCYEPRGTIEVPVVTLHGTRDPVVPIFHETLLASRVAEKGNGAMLVQRSRDAFGHVVFPPADIPTAFVDLVKWVRHGIKPTP